MAIHINSGNPLGMIAGTESVMLNSSQNGTHAHGIAAQSGQGSQAGPGGGFFAASSSVAEYGSSGPNTTGSILNVAGAGQPHENRMPSLVVNYMICTEGLYPQPA